MGIFTIGMFLTGWLLAYVVDLALKEKVDKLLKENNVKRKTPTFIETIKGYLLFFMCGFPIVGFFILLAMVITIGALDLENNDELSVKIKKNVLDFHKGVIK